MEHQGVYLHTPQSSSSSGVDLSNTAAVFATSAPPSPSLEASDSRGSFARRRTSWGHRLVDADRDPLQLDYFPPSSGGLGSAPIRSAVDGLFPAPDDRNFPLSARYGSAEQSVDSYATSHAGPSTASLIAPREFEAEVEQREDDEAHLTANMSRNGTEETWEGDHGEDPEHAATTPHSRRRTGRYGMVPSPLKMTGTTIKSMTHNLRRASLRVVNLGSAGLDHHISLGDGDDWNNPLPIRGRALGCFGPESKVRLALFNLLVYPCVNSLSLWGIFC